MSRFDDDLRALHEHQNKVWSLVEESSDRSFSLNEMKEIEKIVLRLKSALGQEDGANVHIPESLGRRFR